MEPYHAARLDGKRPVGMKDWNFLPRLAAFRRDGHTVNTINGQEFVGVSPDQLPMQNRRQCNRGRG